MRYWVIRILLSVNYFLAENIAKIKYQIYYSVKNYFFPILSKFFYLLPIANLVFKEVRKIIVNNL